MLAMYGSWSTNTVGSHTPATHAVPPQLRSHEPQCAELVIRLVSQPSAAAALQLPKPLVHAAAAHSSATHASPTVLHVRLHALQPPGELQLASPPVAESACAASLAIALSSPGAASPIPASVDHGLIPRIRVHPAPPATASQTTMVAMALPASDRVRNKAEAARRAVGGRVVADLARDRVRSAVTGGAVADLARDCARSAVTGGAIADLARDRARSAVTGGAVADLARDRGPSAGGGRAVTDLARERARSADADAARASALTAAVDDLCKCIRM